MEQLSIFDFLTQDDDVKTWDADINEIIRQLDDVCTRMNLEHDKIEWVVWSHVPQYGFRLTYPIIVHRDTDAQRLMKEIEKVVEYSKERKIELSPMEGAVFFYNSNNAHLRIYSCFMDGRRKRR